MNDSLETLLTDGIIEAVIGQLKTGKEAEVWLVQHAGQVVAAKLYKERHERNFRNNVGYREGREVRNSRTRRAMEKGSRFGQAAAEEAWKSAESDSLYKLHAQGVRVPAPVLFYEGILLMEVVVDAEGHPAPRLVEAPPATPEDARMMYLDLRAQVVSMLCADLIHGDLSPYNILMSWAGPTIIDFPQTIAAARNNRAEFYFRRDLDNVREFLAAFCPSLHGMSGDTGEIWNAYVKRELTPDFVPSGSFREAPRRQGGPSRGGRQDARPQGGDRRRDFRVQEEVVAPEPPKAPMTPEEAAEAELLELQALVLRQGGGERGKPPASPPQRGGRRGAGRPPPRQGNNRPNPPAAQRSGASTDSRTGAHPPNAEQRGANGHPPRGETRNGTPGPGQGDRRNGGPRAFQGDSRNGGQGPVQGDSRNGGAGAFRGDSRNGGHSAVQGDSRTGGTGSFQSDSRTGGTGSFQSDSRNGGPRSFQGERRNGGGPRSFQGDARNGRQGAFQGDSRNGAAGAVQGDARNAGQGPFQGDARNGGPRSVQGDRRNRGPRSFDGNARNGGPGSFQGDALNGGQGSSPGGAHNGGTGHSHHSEQSAHSGDERNEASQPFTSEPRNNSQRNPRNGAPRSGPDGASRSSGGRRNERHERQANNQPSEAAGRYDNGAGAQDGANGSFQPNDSRPPRNEQRRGGPGRGAQPLVENRPAMSAAPASPQGGNTVREPRQNSNGPRQQHPNANRSGPRASRGGPQVSYVARPATPSDSGPTETGS
ncbi:RIO1 family regulatory kinase/ATPase [Myxococcus stipitatus]|uniref:RIO1 family regulatory kinase/ATPase domain-containing protein n=1 Tax=Myxococcus stipitatus TaxID=83455 RepID=UPI0030CBAB3F